MKKYLTVFLAVFLIVLFAFPISALAANGFTDPQEYGYATILRQRAEEIAPSSWRNTWVITADDDYNLYMFGYDYSETNRVSGEYNGHPVYFYLARNSTQGIKKATLTTDWVDLRTGNVIAVYGDKYIQQHLDDVISEFDSQVGGGYYIIPYYYCGSALIGHGSDLSIYNLLTSFFPLASGTVLSSTITTLTLAGVLEELIALLPVLLSTIIIYLALRKGYQFIKQQLQAA